MKKLYSHTKELKTRIHEWGDKNNPAIIRHILWSRIKIIGWRDGRAHLGHLTPKLI